MAWWVWAIGLGAAVSQTDNPLLLLVALAVLGYVVTVRRTDAPWARGLKYYFVLALIVVVLRVVFRSIFGGAIGTADHVLFTLPRLPLPHWAANVQLGGPVSLENTASAAADGMRLAVLLCCIGAANALANPRRALRSLPGALYELGVAVVVCMSVAPQLIESIGRVRRARRLRAGRASGLRAARAIAIPVVEDAFERSLRLAAAMDARGYGRRGEVTAGTRRLTTGCLLAGMVGLSAGAYGLLDTTTPALLGMPTLLVGAALCCAGLGFGGRRIATTRYRPDPWQVPEWLVAGSGVLSAGVLVAASAAGIGSLAPSFSPLAWPGLPLLPAAAILLAALPAVAAPPPPVTRGAVSPLAGDRRVRARSPEVAA
ncbi:MAG TPA: energy-coupling factor transporter transmembrane protein EcfT [Mycobacteriales bacterium]|jgi:energy-coupling factor transport system permease protein|nr:energy-coupling factor transporter transmembrane protein EcfT [Mycobacteriales bacterium]